LADEKRLLACVQNRVEHDASLEDCPYTITGLSKRRMQFPVSTAGGIDCPI
jgi:hypothetical protein